MRARRAAREWARGCSLSGITLSGDRERAIWRRRGLGWASTRPEARGASEIRRTRVRRRRSRRQEARESVMARKENRLRARIAMRRRAFAEQKAGMGCPGWSDVNRP